MAAQKGMRKRRKKSDPFAGDKINQIDYKDVALLKKVYYRKRKNSSEKSNGNIGNRSKKAYAGDKKSKKSRASSIFSGIKLKICTQ